jgi:hypothetical protein
MKVGNQITVEHLGDNLLVKITSEGAGDLLICSIQKKFPRILTPLIQSF